MSSADWNFLSSDFLDKLLIDMILLVLIRFRTLMHKLLFLCLHIEDFRAAARHGTWQPYYCYYYTRGGAGGGIVTLNLTPIINKPMILLLILNMISATCSRCVFISYLICVVLGGPRDISCDVGSQGLAKSNDYTHQSDNPINLKVVCLMKDV